MTALISMPRRAVDVAIAALAITLIEIASWWGGGFPGDRIAGPAWLVALLPLFWAVPLLWRRTYPLAVVCVVMAGFVLHGVATSHSPEGIEVLLVLGVTAYSVGAYATRRHAVVGLAVAVGGFTVYAAEDPNPRSGRTSELWATAFFGVGVIACWLIGVVVQQVRERQLIAQRTSEIEAQAAQAVADERARLARDLHDIVSHNLSVMVVQAAGARARGSSDESTLEKIERSGRASLVEMRRLLGVLRTDGAEATLVPQPGLQELAELAQHVRDSGIPVELSIIGDAVALPAAIELSVYRIVQEALTNVVKHAGSARATVCVSVTSNGVRVQVSDDGRGTAPVVSGSGHGLIGMHERVALLHGQLHAGPRIGGGFEIDAVLPLAITS